MFSELKNFCAASFEMATFGFVWDSYLKDLLNQSRLSSEAFDFIVSENEKTESGRLGYLGKAAFMMGGGDARDPISQKIWLDSSLHLFALRIVDNYFDEYHLDLTFDVKKKALHWDDLIRGSFPFGVSFDSAEQEASVFALETLIRNFGTVPGYLDLMNRLYDTVNRVEDSSLPLEERTDLDLDVAALTVVPITLFGQRYGVKPSPNVSSAIEYMAKGTRIWDHLGDLDKDLCSGAFNFVVEDAKKKVSPEDSVLAYIKNNSGRRFIRRAELLLDQGRDLVDDSAVPIYQVVRKLMVFKYGVEYFCNTRFEGFRYRDVLGVALRSI